MNSFIRQFSWQIHLDAGFWLFDEQRRSKLMDEAQRNWWSIMEKLQVTLRQAALVLFSRGQFTREQLHNYVMSGKPRFSQIFTYLTRQTQSEI
jgi:hypothetical protein